MSEHRKIVYHHHSLAPGSIRSINLKTGFGFVEYDEPRDAEDAVADMHDTTFRGKRLVSARNRAESKAHTTHPTEFELKSRKASVILASEWPDSTVLYAWLTNKQRKVFVHAPH